MGIRSVLSTPVHAPKHTHRYTFGLLNSFGFWKTFKTVRKKFCYEISFDRKMTTQSTTNNFKQVSPQRDDLAAIVFTSVQRVRPRV